MEISPAGVGAACGVVSLVGGGLVRWAHGAIKDEREAREREIASVKVTSKLIFDKLDVQTRDHQEYKLHVAETYLTRTALKEQLEPIHKTLEEIKDDLREERHK